MQMNYPTGHFQLPITRQAGGIWYPSLPTPLKPISAIPSSRASTPAKTSPSHRIIRRIFLCVAQELTKISTNPVFRLFGGILILTSPEPLAEMLFRAVVVFICLRAAMPVYPIARRRIVSAIRNVKKEILRIWSMTVRSRTNRANLEDAE